MIISSIENNPSSQDSQPIERDVDKTELEEEKTPQIFTERVIELLRCLEGALKDTKASFELLSPHDMKKESKIYSFMTEALSKSSEIITDVSELEQSKMRKYIDESEAGEGEESGSLIDKIDQKDRHQLINLFSVVKSGLEALSRRDIVLTQEDEGWYCDLVSIGLDRLIIDVIMLELNNEKTSQVNVKKIIEEIISQNKIEISEKNIRISTDPDLGILKSKETEIYKIFQNLIVNAIKYNDRENPEIQVVYEGKKDGKHYYTIRDNGTGIPYDIIDNLFESGVRGKNSKGQEGQGLGLNIVKRIVQANNGEIGVINNGGVCFRLTLEDIDSCL
jgi:signal transduction histidine kinase